MVGGALLLRGRGLDEGGQGQQPLPSKGHFLVPNRAASPHLWDPDTPLAQAQYSG